MGLKNKTKIFGERGGILEKNLYISSKEKAVSLFSLCSNLKDIYVYSDKPADGFSSCFGKNTVAATLHTHDYAIESFKALNVKFSNYEVFEKVTDFYITYYVNKSEYKKVAYKYGDEITPEPYPEKEEYTFSGWSEIPKYMPGKDVKVYGTLEPTIIVSDGITYQIKDGKAHVTEYDGETAEITILPYVEDRGKKYEVVDITSGIFRNKKTISSVVIPNTVIEIPAYSFEGCSNISKIEIGEAVTDIGERAFANIDKLMQFTCRAKTPPTTDRTAFENSYVNYVTLAVPSLSVDDYKDILPWSGFKEVVPIQEDTPHEGEKCHAPTIDIVNGKVVFACETEDVSYHYNIKCLDDRSGDGNHIELTTRYKISVYASRDGYGDSDTTTKEILISASDSNGDGTVNAADIVRIVNMILSPE